MGIFRKSCMGLLSRNSRVYICLGNMSRVVALWGNLMDLPLWDITWVCLCAWFDVIGMEQIVASLGVYIETWNLFVDMPLRGKTRSFRVAWLRYLTHQIPVFRFHRVGGLETPKGKLVGLKLLNVFLFGQLQNQNSDEDQPSSSSSLEDENDPECLKLRGNKEDIHNPANFYINEVLENRKGAEIRYVMESMKPWYVIHSSIFLRDSVYTLVKNEITGSWRNGKILTTQLKDGRQIQPLSSHIVGGLRLLCRAQWLGESLMGQL